MRTSAAGWIFERALYVNGSGARSPAGAYGKRDAHAFLSDGGVMRDLDARRDWSTPTGLSDAASSSGRAVLRRGRHTRSRGRTA